MLLFLTMEFPYTSILSEYGTLSLCEISKIYFQLFVDTRLVYFEIFTGCFKGNQIYVILYVSDVP